MQTVASTYAHEVDRVRAGVRQQPGSWLAAVEAGLGLADESQVGAVAR